MARIVLRTMGLDFESSMISEVWGMGKIDSQFLLKCCTKCKLGVPNFELGKSNGAAVAGRRREKVSGP